MWWIMVQETVEWFWQEKFQEPGAVLNNLKATELQGNIEMTQQSEMWKKKRFKELQMSEANVGHPLHHRPWNITAVKTLSAILRTCLEI